jgi:hypothetical protein
LIDDYCSIVDRAEMKVVGIKVIYTPDSSDGRSAVRESRRRPIADRPDTLAPEIEQSRINAGVYEHSPGHVMILIEGLHEVRFIPLDGRPPTAAKRPVMAGRFARTLGREYTRSRTGEETIRYEFTVDDPQTWTQPWRAEVPFIKTDGPIFEHACNEGNYSMANMLAGARAEKKKAAEAAAQKGTQ